MTYPAVRPSPAAPQRPVTQSDLLADVKRLGARVTSLEKANAGALAALATLVQAKGEGSRGSVPSRRKNLAVLRETLGETHALYRQTLHSEARALVSEGQADSFSDAVAKLGGAA